MAPTSNKIRIGLITKPHGIKGALKVLPLTPDPRRFEGLEEVWLEKEGQVTLARLTSVQVRKDHVLVQIKGITNPEDGGFWRQAYLCVDKEDRIPLEADTYFVDDLIGLEAYWDGVYFGRLVEVLQPGANDVYVFDRPGKSKVYFPALKSTVESIDLVKKVLHIRIPEGLLEEGDR